MVNQCRAWRVGPDLRHYRRAYKPAYEIICGDTHILTDTRAQGMHTHTSAGKV